MKCVICGTLGEWNNPIRSNLLCVMCSEMVEEE